MCKTIGYVINKLKEAPQHAYVYFDFPYMTPKGINSWRGTYNEAALSFVSVEAYSEDATTVKQLLKILEDAIDGEVFIGWKGGEYQYDCNTKLHVDNPGCSFGTEIKRITFNNYMVIIHTEYNEN